MQDTRYRFNPPRLQTILQSYSNENSMVLSQKQTHDQWNRIQSPCTNGQLLYDKEGKNIQQRKNSVFNKRCWKNWTAIHKTMRLEYSLTQYTKINSKWFKDINIRPETKKLLKETIGGTFLHKL